MIYVCKEDTMADKENRENRRPYGKLKEKLV